MVVLPDGRVDPSDITMVLTLSTWALALQQSLGMADFVVGMHVSLRDMHPGGAAGLVAPLTTILPLRVRVSRCRSFVDLFLEVARSLHYLRNNILDPTAAISAAPLLPVQV